MSTNKFHYSTINPIKGKLKTMKASVDFDKETEELVIDYGQQFIQTLRACYLKGYLQGREDSKIHSTNRKKQ